VVPEGRKLDARIPEDGRETQAAQIEMMQNIAAAWLQEEEHM
jgi:hypothetical protein